MAEAGNLTVRIGAETSGLQRGVRGAQRNLNSLGRHAGDVTRRITALTAAIGLSAGGMVLMARNTMGAIDEQAKLARGLGGTTAALQALDRAAGRAGVSSGELQSATLRLNQRLGQAVIEGGAAADALARIGLRAEDLIKMDIDERMAALADAMKQGGLNAQEMSFTLRELGIRQSAIVNLMQEGGDAIRDSRKAVEDFGVAVSDVDAASIERANDAIDEVGIAITGVRNRIMVELSDTVTTVAEHISNRFREAGQDLSAAIGRAADFAIGKFADILDAAGRVVEFINQNPMMAQFGVLGYLLLGPKGALIGGAIGALFDQIGVKLQQFGVTLNDAEFQGQRLATMEQELARTTDVVSLALEQRNKITNEAERAEFSRAIGLQEMIDKEVELKDEIAGLRAEVDENEEAMTQFDRAMARAQGTTSNLGREMRGVAGAIRDARSAASGEDGAGMEPGSVGMMPGLGGESEEQKKAQEQREKELEALREHLSSRVDLIRESLMEEAQLETERYLDRAEELFDARQLELIGEQEHQQLMRDLAEQHQAKLTEIEEKASRERERLAQIEARNKERDMSQMWTNLISLTSSSSRKMFEIGKAAAIANAVVNTYQGVSKTLSAYPWPIAGVFAGAHLAAGLAQIQSIKSQSFGGGGSVGSSGLSGGGVGGQAAAQQPTGSPEQQQPAGGTLTVEGISPDAIFTGASVRQLAQELIEFQRNGGEVLLV